MRPYFLPHKKLTKIQKKEYQLLSRDRIFIENVLAHVKIMRIVKDKNRNRKDDFRDLIINTAVSLHNHRVTKDEFHFCPNKYFFINI